MAVKPIVRLTKPEVIQVLENITSVGEHHLHGSFHSFRKNRDTGSQACLVHVPTLSLLVQAHWLGFLYLIMTLHCVLQDYYESVFINQQMNFKRREAETQRC